MSTLVSDLINGALVKIADPGARRNARPSMLQYFNEVQHEIATSLRCLEDDYYFALEQDEEAYAYPVDRVQVKSIRVTQVAVPTTIGNYYWLDEAFEEEFRAMTNLIRPSAYIHSYIARLGWFELINRPPSTIASGGIVTAYRLPTWLAAETPTATMELPDLCRVIVQEGMEIKARMVGRDRAAASQDYAKWKVDMMALESKICDPSADRRASLRPNKGLNFRNMR